MIFVGEVVFFVGKVLEIYDPKLFAYQNILALCTLCLETAPRRKRFWKYFRGGAEINFSGQGRAVLKVLRGWASQGTLSRPGRVRLRIPDLVCQFLICLTFIRLLQ